MKKIIIIIILLIFSGYLYYNHAVSSPFNTKGSDSTFTINKGDGVKTIAKNLKDQKIISSEFFFEVHAWLSDLRSSFVAGDYNLNPQMSITEIAKNLTGGGAISREKNLTFIEGWNNKDFAKYLETQGFGTANAFSKLINTNKYNDQYKFLSDKSKTADLEGYLFPDTYRVYKNATQEDILLKMLYNFDQKLSDQMRADITKQGKSVFEIVTMASLLEKEVKTLDDMKIVSGIFWDRIKNGQALESCATLAYTLGENKPQYSASDTQIDSPYNTYKHRGLPPTPICNPGLKAITSAIYPTFTNYNYFLSDPETGKTIFSATYEEHLKNKAIYLK